MHCRFSVLHPAVLLLAAGLFLTIGTPPAQTESSWQCIPAPPGAVTQRGKIAVVPDAVHQYRAFSSATRRWATWPFPQLQVANGFRVANDAALFDAAPTFVGFSSHRGTFERLDAGPNAFVANPTNNRNDSAWVVVDGNDLHVFSGFVGRWTTQSFPAGFRLLVQRDVVLVTAGNQLWGYSGPLGTWSTTTTSGTIQHLAADGSVGIAETATDLYGYSAMQGSWSHQARVPGLGTARAQVSKNVAAWSGTAMLLGYSGVRGAFSLLPTGTPGTLTTGDHWAMLEGPGTQRWMFSGVHARWTQYATATPPTVVTDASLVALVEPGQVHAWSAVEDRWISQNMNSAAVRTSATILEARDANGGAPWLYSGLTGRFHHAPNNAAATSTQLARNAALLWPAPGHGTVYVFSGRDGRFVTRTVTPAASPAIDANSSVVGIVDGLELAWFDPRRGTWRSVTTPVTASPPRIWRTAAVTYAGNRAIGFATLHGRTEVHDFAAPPSQLIASSEIALANDGSTLCAFSATPELLTPAQFPEFRRMAAARGAALPIRVFGPAAPTGSSARSTSVAILSLSLPSALPTPLGSIEIDPRFAVALPLLQLDAAGFGEQLLAIPDDPAAAGVELGCQALFSATDGTLSVSRLATFRVE